MYTATFNVTRSVGRYAVDIIATPTQVSYNQTTGLASSSNVVATINAIDINGKKTENAIFANYGAMKYRYLGEGTWTRPDSQSVSKLEIKPNFTKRGIEFSFVDANNKQLDYETVPFSSVTNGGDAYLVNVASMNVAIVLTSISYGTPTGDATNVVYMTKNNEVLSSGVEYNVPGEDGDEYTLAANGDEANNISYNGWVFNYSYQDGQLTSTLVSVDENSPTSVHIPIDVIYPTDNITRTVMISYSAIQKGPAGRSYKPNTPVLYDPTKTYEWNDQYRDFIYYAFKVNNKGEQDDEKGVLSYFQYGVKEYGMKITDTPPSAKGGDTNWEYISEYKSIIVNCLFGTNAVLGGLKFTSETMESSTTYDDGTPNIKIDGKKGEVIFNKAILRGEVYAKSGSFTGEVNANSGTFSNCTINETCKAGFMKYAANKLNSNVINCGLVNLIDAYGTYGVTAFYLPSVGNGEFMRITILNVVLTRITIPTFTLSIYGSGVFNDFYNFLPGDNRYTRPITILRGDYYEFLGMNDGNGTRWICTNKPLPRI